MPFCVSCGQEIAPEDKHCGYCGHAQSSRGSRDDGPARRVGRLRVVAGALIAGAIGSGILAINDKRTDTTREVECGFYATNPDVFVPRAVSERRVGELADRIRAGKKDEPNPGPSLEEEVAEYCLSGVGNPWAVPFIVALSLGVVLLIAAWVWAGPRPSKSL